MEEQNKLIIKANGGPTIFMLVLIIFFSCIIIAMLFSVIFSNTNAIQGQRFEIIAGMIVLIWLVFYLSLSIRGNNISLDNNIISVKNIDISKFTFRFLPKIIKKGIKLNDIKIVVLATYGYIKDHAEILEGKATIASVPIPVAILKPSTLLYSVVAQKFLPVLYIVLKDSQQESIKISTKPFSKKDFRKLVQALKDRGVNVFVEPGIL